MLVNQWEHLGMICLCGKTDYSVSLLSNPVVINLNNPQSTTVISKLKVIFAKHGIPERINSDFGRQYSSKQCSYFVKVKDSKHVRVSPHYPWDKHENSKKRCIKQQLDTFTLSGSKCQDASVNRPMSFCPAVSEMPLFHVALYLGTPATWSSKCKT